MTVELGDVASWVGLVLAAVSIAWSERVRRAGERAGEEAAKALRQIEELKGASLQQLADAHARLIDQMQAREVAEVLANRATLRIQGSWDSHAQPQKIDFMHAGGGLVDAVRIEIGMPAAMPDVFFEAPRSPLRAGDSFTQRYPVADQRRIRQGIVGRASWRQAGLYFEDYLDITGIQADGKMQFVTLERARQRPGRDGEALPSVPPRPE